MSTAQQEEISVLVIGGGLLGMCVADLAAKRHHRVLVCRLSDDIVPQADTLRNQSWLLSGALFIVEKSGEQLEMRADGRRLARLMQTGAKGLRDFSGEFPDEAEFLGVYRTAAAMADVFTKAARQARVPVQPMTPAKAKAALGPLYTKGKFAYFRTPDTTFDEPSLLDELRRRVMVNHGLLRVVDHPIALIPDPNPSGFLVEVEGARVKPPPTVVLAAGVGNVRLLKDLDLDLDGLNVVATPLLVLPRTTVMPRARIFVDRAIPRATFTLVDHPASRRIPKGSLVIGIGKSERVNLNAAYVRRTTDAQRNAFWRILPQCLLPYRGRGRFTAGLEVYFGDKKEDYWVSKPFPKYQGLIAAVPGRATLSMSAARRIAAAPSLKEKRGVPFPIPGVEWTEPSFMHHEPHYDGLDE